MDALGSHRTCANAPLRRLSGAVCGVGGYAEPGGYVASGAAVTSSMRVMASSSFDCADTS